MPTVAELEDELIELHKRVAEVQLRLTWARQLEETAHFVQIHRSPSIPEQPFGPFGPPTYLGDGPRDVVFDPMAPQCGTQR